MTDLTLGDNPVSVDEVDPQEQALMALKLEENVRALIREEIKAALEDPSFLGLLNTHALHITMRGRHDDPTAFNTRVKDAMRTLLERSYT